MERTIGKLGEQTGNDNENDIERYGNKSGKVAASSDPGKRNEGRGLEGGEVGNPEKEVTATISLVSDKPLTKEERNAKRRERYAQKKAEEGKTVRKRKSSKQTDSSFDVIPLLTTIFGVVSSREGMSHWALSESETKAIGDPLNKIIGESKSLQQINDHADAIALVIACATILVPRLLITINNNKELVNKNGRKERSNKTKAGDSIKVDADKNQPDAGEYMRRLSVPGFR